MQVYDISNWADQHPGGRVISTYAGKDATDVFAGFHSPAAWKLLKPLYVGELLVSICAGLMTCIGILLHLSCQACDAANWHGCRVGIAQTKDLLPICRRRRCRHCRRIFVRCEGRCCRRVRFRPGSLAGASQSVPHASHAPSGGHPCRRPAAGLFRSSKSYYLYKTGSTFAILAAALAALVRWHESMWGLVGSAFLLGLFWQQGGWLAHDYLHHQARAAV